MNRLQSTTINNPFDLRRDVPIDIRFVVNSLKTIDTELPVLNRYVGLLFFDIETKQLYLFEKNTTNYVPIAKAIKDSITTSVTIGGSNWLEHLDKLQIPVGQLLYVTNWGITIQKRANGEYKYHSGDFRIDNTTDFDSIPDEFKVVGTKVIDRWGVFQINRQLRLEDYIYRSISDELPDYRTLIDNKIYRIRSQTYIAHNQALILIGNNEFIKADFSIRENTNWIEHNLFTQHLEVFMFTVQDNVTKPIYVDWRATTNSKIEFDSLIDLEHVYCKIRTV